MREPFTNVNNAEPLSVSFGFIYYLCSIFPLVMIVICSIICYSYGHQNLYTFMPNVSEMMVTLPESRIFSVTMSIEAILMLLFGYIRDHFFTYYLFLSPKRDKIGMKIMLHSTRVLLIIASASMIAFGCTPVRYDWKTHCVGAAAFFICIDIYFAVGDGFISAIHKRPAWYSILATALAFFFFVGSIGLRQVSSENTHYKFWWAAGSIFEFLAITSLFLKIILVRLSEPRNSVSIKAF